MPEVCPICEGAGLRILQENGRQVAAPCVCRIEQRAARMLQRASIPRRYEHCTIDNFDTDFPGSNPTLVAARFRAKSFVTGYPVDTNDSGLFFYGSLGVGKTHLAVGVLRSLIEERGATGLFYDYRDLLKEIQSTYSPATSMTEMAVLKPVFAAEVLVLDELGAAKPTEWVWDTVAHIINTRYNDRRLTIITSNYPNLPSLAPNPVTNRVEENLGDRIGDRMRSRLHEMCVLVEMQGQDFRQTVKRARFG